MAISPSEAAEASLSVEAAVYNLGTFTATRLRAIRASERITTQRLIPVVIDPVGIHSYTLRRRFFVRRIRQWMQRYRRDQLACVLVFRMNQSELIAVHDAFCNKIMRTIEFENNFSGVDSVCDNNSIESICNNVTRYFNDRLPVCFVITGRLDYVFATRAFRMTHNGEIDARSEHAERHFPMTHDRDCEMLSEISGGGCMLDSVIASYLAIHRSAARMDACVMALSDYVEAACLAQEKCPGPGHFRGCLIDELAIIARRRFSA